LKLADGADTAADTVVSAADGHSTIFELLEGRFVDDRIRRWYDTVDTFPSYVQVSLGVAKTFTGEPRSLYFPLASTLRIDPESETDYIGLNLYHYDPTLAPHGKTMLTALFDTRNHPYWTDLRKSDPERYRTEKSRIAEETVKAIDRRFGDVARKVEAVDVSTPATVIRYTNNWKGSFEGWLLTPKVGLKQMRTTLPGLAGFHMIGQWVSPGGGLPSALLTARNLAQVLCKRAGKPFVTTAP
jgi:phytoene dehydrogenase-like protein